jgi:DNA-binding transcriptional LysR family regulator
MFMISAQKVLTEVADAERTLSELSSMQCGTLSVYASQTVSNYWLPTRVGEFRRRYPGIKLKLTIGNTEQVVGAVLDGSADLGFVEGRAEDPALDQIELPGDRLVLVFPAGRSASRYDGRNLADLKEIPWVLREKGSGTRQIFEDALTKQGIDPQSLNVVLELPSNESVLMAVEAGIGATVISRFVAERSRLRSVDIGLAPRVFRALRHRERFFGEAQRTMLEIAGRAPDNVVSHRQALRSKRGVA